MPATRFPDNRIYADPEIFTHQRDEIFDRMRRFVCRESEVDQPFGCGAGAWSI